MGFQFSKLGDTLLKFGQSTLQTGVFYASTKALNSPCGMNNSVFGCGSFGTCGGYSGMGYGMGYSMGGYSMPMMDPYAAQMAIGQAYGRGYALGEQLNAQEGNGLMGSFGNWGNFGSFGASQQKTQSLKPTDNKAAEKFENQSTELGEYFEENTQAKNGTRFVKSDWKDMEDGKEKDAKYKEYVTNMGKSYIAHIDKTSGNEDNEISKEEFTNYNLEVDMKKDATEAEKAEAKKSAEIAFKKMDQNGDGKVDWKEMAAVFSTYDSIQDGKHDGEVTIDEVRKAAEQSTNPYSTTIDQKFRTEYTRLFGTAKKEE